MTVVYRFLLLIITLSGSVNPENRTILAAARPGTSEITLPDGLPAHKKPSETTPEVPEGFSVMTLQKTESLIKFCGEDSLCEALFMKVNRYDRRRIPAGKTVLMPIDIQKALEYVPIPKQISDYRGEREIRVFLALQYFGAYENGAIAFWGPVSSGKKSRPTRPGKFVVNYKQRYKRSIKYHNAPMPYSINYNGGYFIHEQSLPGYPASHGCIRLLMSDAKKLFYWIKIGDPVTVQ